MTAGLTPAIAEQQEDNAHIRVTRWSLPPKSETGHHAHEYPYVIVPVTGGTLSVIEDDGRVVEAPLAAGVSNFREAGASHNVTNRGEDQIVFLEVEIKPTRA